MKRGVRLNSPALYLSVLVILLLYVWPAESPALIQLSAGPTAVADPIQSLQSLQSTQSLQSLKERLAGELAATGLTHLVRLVPGSQVLIIRMDASVLFESGRAELTSRSVHALDTVGQVLATTGHMLRVEGHTDSDPLIPSSRFPDNWTLSSSRATGVLRFLHEFHQIPYRRMSVAGYADTRPVATNGTAEGKARNRRVDIVVEGVSMR